MPGSGSVEKPHQPEKNRPKGCPRRRTPHLGRRDVIVLLPEYTNSIEFELAAKQYYPDGS